MPLHSGAPAPLLTSVVNEWISRGWPLEDLSTFRMEAGDDDTGEGGDDDKGAAGDDGKGDDKGGDDDPLAKANAEAEKWKALARKHESQAKANATKAKEFDQLKASQMSETEKAVEEAKQAGRAEAMAETGKVLAAAEIRVALTGVVSDPAEIVEDLDLSKYLTDTGEVDTEKVEKLRRKYEAMAKPVKGSGPDLKQGNRGGDAPAQLTRADMAAMTPEQIVKARQDGRLNEVLGIKSP